MYKSDKVDEGQKANERRQSFQDTEVMRATKLTKNSTFLSGNRIGKSHKVDESFKVNKRTPSSQEDSEFASVWRDPQNYKSHKKKAKFPRQAPQS